ncbi:MAG TPA: cytochrome c3 family protein, partial [Stellaceae bacterium]|nr:cytochrome c3 family protein [Stellaceae bacterium]
YWTHIGLIQDQPVPFSHKHHVGGLGLDCRYCHQTVETSANAGMPSSDTCMSCHSQIWTNAPMLAPVRQSLADKTPLVWNRVDDIPDYAYFDHSIHVAKGVACETCHGRVDRMPLMQKVHSMNMGWCLDCHRDPAPNLRPHDAVFAMGWQRDVATPTPAALLDAYHVHLTGLTDCTTCHR